MSDKPAKYIDLTQILGKNNKPLTRETNITPEDYKVLAKQAPRIKAFFQSPEGQKIAKNKDLSFREKLVEADRIMRAQWESLN